MFNWGSTQPIPPFKNKPTPSVDVSPAVALTPPPPRPVIAPAFEQNEKVDFDQLLARINKLDQSVDFRIDNGGSMGSPVVAISPDMILFVNNKGGNPVFQTVERLDNNSFARAVYNKIDTTRGGPVNVPTFWVVNPGMSGGKKRIRKKGTRKNNKK